MWLTEIDSSGSNLVNILSQPPLGQPVLVRRSQCLQYRVADPQTAIPSVSDSQCVPARPLCALTPPLTPGRGCPKTCLKEMQCQDESSCNTVPLSVCSAAAGLWVWMAVWHWYYNRVKGALGLRWTDDWSTSAWCLNLVVFSLLQNMEIIYNQNYPSVW